MCQSNDYFLRVSLKSILWFSRYFAKSPTNEQRCTQTAVITQLAHPNSINLLWEDLLSHTNSASLNHGLICVENAVQRPEALIDVSNVALSENVAPAQPQTVLHINKALIAAQGATEQRASTCKPQNRCAHFHSARASNSENVFLFKLCSHGDHRCRRFQRFLQQRELRTTEHDCYVHIKEASSFMKVLQFEKGEHLSLISIVSPCPAASLHQFYCIAQMAWAKEGGGSGWGEGGRGVGGDGMGQMKSQLNAYVCAGINGIGTRNPREIYSRQQMPDLGGPQHRRPEPNKNNNFFLKGTKGQQNSF